MTDKDVARDYATARGAYIMLYPMAGHQPRPVDVPLTAFKTLFAGLFGARRWPKMN